LKWLRKVAGHALRDEINNLATGSPRS
jgi:hypothetical protein